MIMKTRFIYLLAAALITSFTLQTASAATAASDLKIKHRPIKWGVKGQPLTLKARVAGGVGGINKVTLYYALFRDAAPFRVNMTSSGIGLYVGTIEAGLLSGVDTISYYVEAEDKEGTIEETPWYDVTFKDADPSQKSRTVVSPTGNRSAAADDESSSATIGLIAGGAAAIAVGAYVISDSDSGGSSSGDGSGDPANNTGTYEGSATTCVTIPPDDTTCSFSSISIIIDPNGKVFSDTLLPGQELVGNINDNSFSLEGDVSGTGDGVTGTIIFSGSVIGGEAIIGTINGNIMTNGTPGFYSGDFNASK